LPVVEDLEENEFSGDVDEYMTKLGHANSWKLLKELEITVNKDLKKERQKKKKKKKKKKNIQ
jgi:hypothetical protein